MFSKDELREIMPMASSAKIEKFYLPLLAAMSAYEIDNSLRISAFLAQVAHESMSLQFVRELASGDAYTTRADLGNTRPEAVAIAAEHGTTPGPWWRGHGLIQITGYDNHLACGDELGLDLVHHPELLEQPEHAAMSAAWFWNSHGLNELADREDFLRITKKINGGTNGWKDRVAFYERAKETLSI